MYFFGFNSTFIEKVQNNAGNSPTVLTNVKKPENLKVD